MKYRPFIEIIDFEKELKEYKLLCRRKSKKFTFDNGNHSSNYSIGNRILSKTTGRRIR